MKTAKTSSRALHLILRSAALPAMAVLALGTLGACSGADVGSDSAFSTDSFAHPTEHGELIFGAPNHASFDESHRFHSWTFTLSDEAALSLRTELFTPNLDTAVYLYRREPGQDNWGSNIESNDDHDGEMWSLIDGTFGAGEYRLKVKTAKTSFSGDFAVLASCEGDGCPANGGTCSPDHPVDMPAETQFTASCAPAFTDVMLAPVDHQWSTAVRYSERCEVGGLVARAVDFYRDYWEGVGYWEDMTEGEDASLNARVKEHGDAGTVVSIDVDTDEDVVDFVFDGYGALVMYFHHASYSEEGWFCAKPGEPPADKPADYNEDCAGMAIASLQHEAGSVTNGQGTTTLGSPDPALPSFIRVATNSFSEAVALEHEDDPISYSYVMWDSLHHGQAVELTLSAHGTTVGYLVGEGWGGGGYTFLEINDGVPTFVCDEGDY